MSDINPLGLSDEDFLNMNGPTDVVPDGSDVAQTPQSDPAEAVVTPPEEGEAAPQVSVEDSSAVSEPIITETPSVADPVVADPVDNADPAPVVDPVANVDPAPVTNKTETVPVTPEAAVEFYNEMMKPFKANGKMIELRSPEEVKSLVQMGANYTRKMQELAPFRKTLLMLQNNSLLDPDKLSFFIDLNNGDPEAVKKFIKDRGIDPLDIDTSTDPAYLGGNHHVTDEEVSFQSTLEELRSTPAGEDTLKEVATRWDNTSKEMLWKNPEVLPIIQEQRESGVYDVIVAEMDRQRTLGKLRADMPFLDAYRKVGDEFVSQSGNVAPTANPTPAPQLLATRVAAPKSAINANDQAIAAAPSRGTVVQPKDFVNPLAMSDEQFLKQMENRL